MSRRPTSQEHRDDISIGDELFREVVHSLPLMVWAHDPSGRHLFVNQTYTEYFGLTLEELQVGRWQTLLHPDDADAYTESFGRSLEQRAAFHAEARVRRADGAWRWLESWGRPRWSANGEYRGMCGTSADVTEQRESKEKLRESDRRKDEFMAMLGHELRNPLAAIRTATELLTLGGVGEQSREQARGVLDRQSSHMTRLIDGLLDVTRIGRGRIELEVTDVDLRELLETALDDRERMIRERGLTLGRDLPASSVWVRGDPVRLTQVIDNLVGNAIKFTEPPGRVNVALRTEGDRATVSVTDTGRGMSVELLERVFEPFMQAATSLARSEGGLGLGLALAKGLVELHGGQIEAKSEGPGRGTEMQLWVPWTGELRARPPRRGRSRGRGLSILLVEDNVDAALLMATLLEHRGHEVCAVHDGHAALRALDERLVDVVLCDLGLPEMDGYELARRVRDRPDGTGLTMIAVSGYGLESDRERSTEAGFDAHLVKPIDVDDLDAVLP